MKALLLKFSGGIFVAAIVCAFFATTAHAATFSVNTTDDGNDANPGDGICEITIATDDCGIRALIEETNALAGADVGNFNVPGAGVHTFIPGDPLGPNSGVAYPQIVDTLTIDGSTQPGASCGTLVPTNLPGAGTEHTLLIEIDGSNATIGTLTIGGDAINSVLRGLVMNNSAEGSVSIGIYGYNVGFTGVLIECNYIGTNVAGNTAITPANSNGINAYTPGGTVQNNLISGHKTNSDSGFGLTLYGEGAIAQNNLIGTDSTGNNALSNQTGISLPTNDSDLTTPQHVSHNIISGNLQFGIKNGQETYGGTNALITGNYIGVGSDGGALGNGSDGIYSISASNFTIGGTTAQTRNVISNNGGNGIHVFAQGDDGSACNGSYNGKITGNYIGTNTSGDVAAGFGNQQSGVAVNEIESNCSHGTISGHTIGGDVSGESNTIAGNTLDGVRIYQVPNTNTDVYNIAVLPNNIFGNGNLGVNLAADVGGTGTANTDLGPNVINSYLMSYPAAYANYFINHPVVNSSTYMGNQLTINYNFQANQADESTVFQSDVVGYRLDFYINDDGQDGAYAGYAQGKRHLGSFIVNGSETNASHTFTSPVTPSSNYNITTTATVLWAAPQP